MAFNISALMDDISFLNSPHVCLNQLFHLCHDDTLIIPRYLDDNPSYPFYHDHYEMHWTEEDCKKIHDAFENLYNDLHSIAESGSVNEDIDDEQVKRAVMQADSNPDHYVTVYAKRLCSLISFKAPELIINNEAVSLAISMAVNRYSTAYHKEDCDELTEKAIRYDYEYQMLASAAGYRTEEQELSGLEETKELVRRVDHALDCLTEEEKEVLKKRFIERTTLDDAAKWFGCSKEQIRKIEVVAIRKMREHITGSPKDAPNLTHVDMHNSN